jgi:hypothetical protein
MIVELLKRCRDRLKELRLVIGLLGGTQLLRFDWSVCSTRCCGHSSSSFHQMCDPPHVYEFRCHFFARDLSDKRFGYGNADFFRTLALHPFVVAAKH